ncbi:MAG: ABC transporter ATP-binding protein [Patescibacteria group bacterium]
MNLRESPIIYLTKRLWEFSKGNRKSVVSYLGLFFLGNVVQFFRPLAIGHLLNILQQYGLTSDSLRLIILALAVVVGIEVGFWAFHGPARILESTNAFFVRKNLKEYLLRGTMDLPASWHTDHHSGDTIDKIEKAGNGMYNYAVRTFEVVELILRFVGSYLALVYFDLNASYILIIMVLLTLGVISHFDKVLVKQYTELYKMENRISAKVFDIISNITTVIILRVEKLVLKSIVQKIFHPFGLYKKNIRVNEWKWFWSSALSAFTMALILLSYLYHQYTLGAVVLVGTVYALYGYVERINDTFFRFAYLYNEVMQYKTAVKNSEALSDLFSQRPPPPEVPLGKRWKHLDIKQLRFSYGGSSGVRRNLDNVTVRLNHGEKIALIGDSGAGKTTFLKVFRGLYTPQHVRVEVDGQILPHGFHSISHEIALIPQDPEIFSTTIRENITIGVTHTQGYIERFVQMAQFTDVVNRLPKKYNSSVVEKGVNLSGGEKQRLALARGLLASQDKFIILLDEPTSSVDTKNELIIYKRIFDEYPDKTVISTIHRLHLLPLFDRIILFSEGRVIGDGGFTQLLQSSEEFRRLWDTYTRAQSSGGLSHDDVSSEI